jgi:hypothetical protein
MHPAAMLTRIGHRLRRSAVLATAVLTLVSAGVVLSAPAQAFSWTWYVKNYTHEPIFFSMSAVRGSSSSSISRDRNNPILWGDQVSASISTSSYAATYRGQFCYRGSWWYLTDLELQGGNVEFSLTEENGPFLIIRIYGKQNINLSRREPC